jgi:hypothetical protein
MGYLKDLGKDVFLLRDPLEDKAVGRRNKVAKHIKSRADAKEAMLVLCQEGQMELVGNNLFRVLNLRRTRSPQVELGLALTLRTANLLRRSQSRLKLSQR